MSSNGTGGVAYLTTIAVEKHTPQIPLWRAISGGGDLWFERYGHDGWREDEDAGRGGDRDGHAAADDVGGALDRRRAVRRGLVATTRARAGLCARVA